MREHQFKPMTGALVQKLMLQAASLRKEAEQLRKEVSAKRCSDVSGWQRAKCVFVHQQDLRFSFPDLQCNTNPEPPPAAHCICLNRQVQHWRASRPARSEPTAPAEAWSRALQNPLRKSRREGGTRD